MPIPADGVTYESNYVLPPRRNGFRLTIETIPVARTPLLDLRQT